MAEENGGSKAEEHPRAECSEGEKGCDKCMTEAVGVVIDSPFGGAETFADADAHEEGRLRENKLSWAQHQLSSVIGNIMRNPERGASETASLISTAATDFATRVGEINVMQIDVKDRLVDLFAGIIRSVKAKWSTKFVNNLPDSAFAFVESGDKNGSGKTTPRSKRHFPHHGSDGKVDLPHLRNALARAGQSSNGAKALPHLERHATKLGVGGREQNISSFKVTKEDGVWRWLAIFSNRFKDRDGEFFSDEAHKAFEAYVDETGEYPELWGFHQPGSKCGVADFVTYANGFMLASGTFDKGMDDVALKLAERDDLGVSHGFYHQKPEDADTYEKYVTFEISHLTQERASNLWTAFDAQTIKEVVQMGIRDDKRAYLVGVYGEDRVDGMEKAVAKLEKGLLAHGVDFKEWIEAWEFEDKDEGDGDDSEGDGAAAPADTKPAEGAAASADGKPADGDGKPADGDGKPADADATPTEGQAELKTVLAEALSPIAESIKGLQADVDALKSADDDDEGDGDGSSNGHAPKAATRKNAPPTNSDANVISLDFLKDGDKEDGEDESPAAPYVGDLVRAGSGPPPNDDPQ